ncbi:MAG: DUF2127 domain-containing protein [Verrucomicrobia bacterium]|nr:DUF2127 domain-containing protein [Verrucomicrobiota bacterium]
MADDVDIIEKRAPALTAIITFKIGKGMLFALLAIGFWALSDNDLPWEYNHLLQTFHIDGKRKFYMDLAAKIARIKETDVLWVAAFTLVYGLNSVVEGIGLAFRQGWASWLCIAESAIFIPAETLELVRNFSIPVLVILIMNIFIVVYLFRNRNRLFHHIHFRHHPAQ